MKHLKTQQELNKASENLNILVIDSKELYLSDPKIIKWIKIKYDQLYDEYLFDYQTGKENSKKTIINLITDEIRDIFLVDFEDDPKYGTLINKNKCCLIPYGVILTLYFFFIFSLNQSVI